MSVRNNHDDFTTASWSFQQAWIILGGVECEPSIEIFEYGYLSAAHDRRGLTPQQYAHQLVSKYQRTDKEKWWVYSHADGRLIDNTI